MRISYYGLDIFGFISAKLFRKYKPNNFTDKWQSYTQCDQNNRPTSHTVQYLIFLNVKLYESHCNKHFYNLAVNLYNGSIFSLFICQPHRAIFTSMVSQPLLHNSLRFAWMIFELTENKRGRNKLFTVLLDLCLREPKIWGNCLRHTFT